MDKMNLDEMLERYRKQRLIICPRCDFEHEISDLEDNAPVSYWGEAETKEIDCYNCGQHFWVKEHVSRTFTTGKTEEEAG